jgi:hypothetical protein
MANLNSRRRWRGPALGGRLQRGARFCFSAHDGEATTSRLAEWLRPELVYAGRRPTAVQMVNGARALRSIGAKRIRRIGRSEWVWQLSDSDAATSESGRVRKNPSKMRCRKANKTRHF